MAETAGIQQVRQALEGYEERKYKKWKTVIPTTDVQGVVTDTRDAEQRAFDEYVKEIANSHGMKICHYIPNNYTASEVKRRSSASVVYTRDLLKVQNSEVVNLKDNLIIKIRPTDRQYDMYVLGHVTYVLDQQITIQGVGFLSGADGYSREEADAKFALKGEGGGGSVNITASASANTLEPNQPATAIVTKTGDNLEFTFGIPKGEKGQAGGGAGGGGLPSSIQLPSGTDSNAVKGTTVKGEYGLNLINYRKLNLERKYGVNGKQIYNWRPESIETINTEEALDGFLGVKSKRKITFRVETIENKTKDRQGAVKFVFAEKEGARKTIELAIPTNPSDSPTSQSDTPDKYGQYKIYLGTKNNKPNPVNPEMFRVKVDAYYGNHPPKGLTRDFEFKEHNGYKLMATAGGTYQDEYVYGANYNYIKKKVGICRLRDLKLHKFDDGQEVWLEIPSDCKVPDLTQSPANPDAETLANDIMSDNLSEIKPDAYKGSGEKRPYFVNIPAVDSSPENSRNGKWYWRVVLDVKYAVQWREHLENTTITYPLKEEKEIPLREGGFTLMLSNGTSINSFDYKTITEVNGVYRCVSHEGGITNIDKNSVVGISGSTKVLM